jgi:hypothetical protein
VPDFLLKGFLKGHVCDAAPHLGTIGEFIGNG